MKRHRLTDRQTDTDGQTDSLTEEDTATSYFLIFWTANFGCPEKEEKKKNNI